MGRPRQGLDRLVVLDHGRIVERGGHATLLAAGCTYAQLWCRQPGGFEAAEEAPADAAAGQNSTLAASFLTRRA